MENVGIVTDTEEIVTGVEEPSTQEVIEVTSSEEIGRKIAIKKYKNKD